MGRLSAFSSPRPSNRAAIRQGPSRSANLPDHLSAFSIQIPVRFRHPRPCFLTSIKHPKQIDDPICRLHTYLFCHSVLLIKLLSPPSCCQISRRGFSCPSWTPIGLRTLEQIVQRFTIRPHCPIFGKFFQAFLFLRRLTLHIQFSSSLPIHSKKGPCFAGTQQHLSPTDSSASANINATHSSPVDSLCHQTRSGLTHQKATRRKALTGCLILPSLSQE